MSTKQTKESIEAELNASDVERIALQLQEVARDAELVEKDLRALADLADAELSGAEQLAAIVDRERKG